MAKILITKWGALGDLVQALSAIKTIRQANLDAHITLLTSPVFAPWMRQCPWLNEVWEDARKPFWTLEWLKFRRRILREKFDLVFDLQNSQRSGFYWKMLGSKRPKWSGVVAGATYRQDPWSRRNLPVLERLQDQLKVAGIDQFLMPDLSWMTSTKILPKLPEKFVILVAGASAHRGEKIWPIERFMMLAKALISKGIMPVWIGGAAEATLKKEIAVQCPESLDLIGQTDFFDLAQMARQALGFVGNDTGPCHLLAYAGCPGVMLFMEKSRPALVVPPLSAVKTLVRERVDLIDLQDVWSLVQNQLLSKPD